MPERGHVLFTQDRTAVEAEISAMTKSPNSSGDAIEPREFECSKLENLLEKPRGLELSQKSRLTKKHTTAANHKRNQRTAAPSMAGDQQPKPVTVF